MTCYHNWAPKITEVPDMVLKQRTLLERIFSWPWRPFVLFSLVDNPKAPPKGTTYAVGEREVVCRKSDAREIRRLIREASL